jgi:DMSO/TMAO reductase YedYZ heme-binding membrane subunit
MDTLGSIVYLFCLVGSCHIVARRGVRTGLTYKPWFVAMVLSAAILMPFVAIYVFLFRKKIVDPHYAQMLNLREELTRTTAEAMLKARNQEQK